MARFAKIFFMKSDSSVRRETPLKGRRIVMGVCSSIAVYKAADIVSALRKLGADVTVIMTANARKLISERIFQTLSRNKVYCDMWCEIDSWKPEHISLAESAELLLVAPATANMIGNFACGLAPDMLSSVYMATKAKVLIAPAMNGVMYESAAVSENIEKLAARGVKFVGPDSGELACGSVQKGRLACVGEIISAVQEILK